MHVVFLISFINIYIGTWQLALDYTKTVCELVIGQINDFLLSSDFTKEITELFRNNKWNLLIINGP